MEGHKNTLMLLQTGVVAIPGPLQLLYAHLVQSQSQKMTLAWSLPQQASVDLLLQPSEPPPCHS